MVMYSEDHPTIYMIGHMHLLLSFYPLLACTQPENQVIGVVNSDNKSTNFITCKYGSNIIYSIYIFYFFLYCPFICYSLVIKNTCCLVKYLFSWPNMNIWFGNIFFGCFKYRYLSSNQVF